MSREQSRRLCAGIAVAFAAESARRACWWGWRRKALGTKTEVPVRPKRASLISCAFVGAAVLCPAQASAQPAHLFVSAGYVARPPYFGYSPFFYDPFFFGLGWSQWYPYPYPSPYPYPPPPYYYGRPYNISAARLEIKPRNAQVYLDGYYVGVVNDFDGTWQRLDLPSGDHEITVYLQGYQTYRQRTFFRPGQDYHFKAILEPLAAGASQEPPPQPPPQPGFFRLATKRATSHVAVTATMPRRQTPPGEANGFGTLSLQVQPADATVTIDGERWDSPEGGSRLVVQLAAGPHQIEVRKEGLRTYTSTIDVRPGETQPLNISLVRE